MKKTIVLGIVGALGVAGSATAASADGFARGRVEVRVAAPVAAADGYWNWNGFRYEWVPRVEVRREIRDERYGFEGRRYEVRNEGRREGRREESRGRESGRESGRGRGRR